MKVNDKSPYRHSREGGNPSLVAAINPIAIMNTLPTFIAGCADRKAAWATPAKAGMTERAQVKRRKAACKPSSVPRARLVYAREGFLPMERGTATIYLALPLPRGSSGQPGDSLGIYSPSIWPCTGWGLPCPRCCHRGGELLPRHFTLIPQ